MRVSYPAVAIILSLEVCKAIHRISALWCSSSLPKEMKSFFPVYLSHLIIDRSLLHENIVVGVTYMAVIVSKWPLYSIGSSMSMLVNWSFNASYNLLFFLSLDKIKSYMFFLELLNDLFINSLLFFLAEKSVVIFIQQFLILFVFLNNKKVIFLIVLFRIKFFEHTFSNALLYIFRSLELLYFIVLEWIDHVILLVLKIAWYTLDFVVIFVIVLFCWMNILRIILFFTQLSCVALRPSAIVFISLSDHWFFHFEVAYSTKVLSGLMGRMLILGFDYNNRFWVCI